MKNINNLIMNMEYGVLASHLNDRTKFYVLLDSLLKLEEACEKMEEK
jgi:hypothetical protein